MRNDEHVMLYYKGDLSALVLFCKWPNGGLCYPPLPFLSSIMEEDEQKPEGIHQLHPTHLLDEVNKALSLEPGILELEPGYYQRVEQPDGIKTVYMARFKLLDPPHHLLEPSQCKFGTLQEFIGGSPTEMELLRRAYTELMED